MGFLKENSLPFIQICFIVTLRSVAPVPPVWEPWRMIRNGDKRREKKKSQRTPRQKKLKLQIQAIEPEQKIQDKRVEILQIAAGC